MSLAVRLIVLKAQMEGTPLSARARSELVLHAVAGISAFGQVELGDALIGALRRVSLIGEAEHRLGVNSPSLRTETARLSNDWGIVARNGPVGVSAEMPRLSSDDEPSMLLENEMRLRTSGPAANAFTRTIVPGLAPARAAALRAES